VANLNSKFSDTYKYVSLVYCIKYINELCAPFLCDYTSPVLHRVSAVLTRHLQEAVTVVYRRINIEGSDIDGVHST
jgi:hypothetical protein